MWGRWKAVVVAQVVGELLAYARKVGRRGEGVNEKKRRNYKDFWHSFFHERKSWEKEIQ